MKFRTRFDAKYQEQKQIFWTDPFGKQMPGEDEDLVQHSMAAECDINTIMARYQKTGELTHVASQAAIYGDFYDVTDYKTGQERLLEADALFMELPAKLRDRFDNDPAKFVAFATDEKNLDELRELGLAEPAPVEPEAPITRKDLQELVTPKAAPKTPPE